MITPSQLRSAARFGTPLRKDTLLELADMLENSRRCDQPPTHTFLAWENVSQTKNEWVWMRACKYCGAKDWKKSKPMEVG